VKISIESASIQERDQQSRRTQQPFKVRTQSGFVRLGREVRQIEIGLERDQLAYAPGEYQLLDASFAVDQYGRLTLKPFGRLSLEAVKPLGSVAAAARVAG
jgi:hypothetical protein